MSLFEQIVERVTAHSRIAIVVMLVLTAGITVGATEVEQESSLDQFQTDSVEADKLDYIESNFSSGDENTTTAQIIRREKSGNVLDKASLVDSLQFQRDLRTDDRTADTLTGERPTVGIANVIATAAIRREEAADVRSLATKIQRLNQSVQRQRAALQRNRTRLNESRAALQENRTELEAARAALERDRAALQNRSDRLNATARQLRAGLTTLRSDRSASVDAVFQSVRANTSVTLNQTDRQLYGRAARQIRSARNQSAVESAYTLGTRGVLRDDYRALDEKTAELRERGRQLRERAAALQERGDQLKQRGEQLQERGEKLQADVERLQSLADELQTERAQLANATNATLGEQLDQVESMNATEIDDVIGLVLSEDGSSGRFSAFALMPTSYDTGSTEASATMILVTQESSTDSVNAGAASETIEKSQLAMQEIAESRNDEGEYLIFGSGIISHEISASQEDSLQIVGPLAALFVLLALIVAYRDLIDIVLGLAGIAAVLGWTFGFMGWLGIDFNQIFVAVPVLLIGLSIDYAIHIFMRHREERQAADGVGPRRSMAIALGGVGIALVWVTATTVIGFLSNLISPVPPIRDFGVVSSFGITAAFLIFGVLIPSLKVEIDELLERYGVDREMTAFGTGGGAFSTVLSLGSTAAQRAPYVVIAFALVVTAAGGVGATQVDTSFSQSDFLAEDPPSWMDDLPEAIRPGEYTAKANLEYVNDNFVREDTQAQILIEGDVTDPKTLDSLSTAADQAAEKDVTQTLSNGEADIESPIETMQAVAARNETFNETFTAADTDDDGVPDENVTAVYDTLFDVAPEEAKTVLSRTEDGEYEAARVVISVKGGASGSDITTQMRDVAAVIEGTDVTVTATGSAILNKIVQDELLRTVVESLIVTLIAVFLFLMATYRVTQGSASLGVVTLLPVAFSVAWILGTMFLADIPFNVLTGTITSLTVGLGVAYSIHLSERYNQELERTSDVWKAMDRAVTGTGGALLGSAATTAGGFGVLVFAILPPLQQFGTITGMTIVYAFLAAVFVLPSLLVVWTRYLGPEWAAAQIRGEPAPAADVGDGAVPPGSGTADGEVASGAGTDTTSAGRTGESVDRAATAGVDPTADATNGAGVAAESSSTADADTAATESSSTADADTAATESSPTADADTAAAGRETATGAGTNAGFGGAAGEPRGASAGESRGAAAGETRGAAASETRGTATSDAGGGPNQRDEWGDAGFVPASVVDGGPRARRELDATYVPPDATVTVRVVVEEADGRFVLREECSDLAFVVQSTDPTPVDVVERGPELNVAWDVTGRAEVVYELHLPADVTDGTEYTVTGTLLTDDRDREVGGERTVTVVADLFERVVSAGEVTDEDLRLAREQLEADALSEAQFDRIYRAWLRDGGSQTPELPDGAARRDGVARRDSSERTGSPKRASSGDTGDAEAE